MKRLKRKGRGGFSLVECLVAVLILSLMSSVACMGVSTALQDRAQAIVVANAQTVASTAAQAVADQVRYGQIVQVNDDSVVLVSSTYGALVRLELDSQGHLVAQGVSAAAGAGGAVSYTPVGEAYALLGEKAYDGMALDSLAFHADETGGVVSAVRIALSIDSQPSSGAGDSEHLWSLEYTVSPMNSHMVSGL